MDESHIWANEVGWGSFMYLGLPLSTNLSWVDSLEGSSGKDEE